MLHPALQALYRAVTGTPYYASQVASREYGPCPAAIYETQLAELTDEQAHAAWERLKAAHAALRAAKRDGVWPAGWTAARFFETVDVEDQVRSWVHAKTKVGAAR